MRHSILISIFFVFFNSCSHSGKNKDNTVFANVRDSYGRERILEKEPRRVISLSPAISEMIYALGQEDKLVGRTDYCSYPQEVLGLPSVGGIQNPSLETIIAFNPDLVLFGTILPEKVVAVLEKAGIQSIALISERNMEGVFKTISTLGVILNAKREAKELVRKMSDDLQEIKLQVKTKAIKPKVYYVIGYGRSGDFSAGRTSYIHEMIELAGGENIAADCKNWSFSRELLIKRDPDFIFIRKEELANFINTPLYQGLNAVKKAQVYPIESGWIDTQGPRNILAIQYISKVINQ